MRSRVLRFRVLSENLWRRRVRPSQVTLRGNGPKRAGLHHGVLVPRYTVYRIVPYGNLKREPDQI
jgi:hypothetical protein